MNAEMFFERHNIPIKRMVSVGTNKHGLSPAAIRESAKLVYEEVKNGAEIPPIRLAWEVYARAKHLRVAAEHKEHNYQEQIDKLQHELEYHRLPWWKKLLKRYVNGCDSIK